MAFLEFLYLRNIPVGFGIGLSLLETNLQVVVVIILFIRHLLTVFDICNAFNRFIHSRCVIWPVF